MGVRGEKVKQTVIEGVLSTPSHKTQFTFESQLYSFTQLSKSIADSYLECGGVAGQGWPPLPATPPQLVPRDGVVRIRGREHVDIAVAVCVNREYGARTVCRGGEFAGGPAPAAAISVDVPGGRESGGSGRGASLARHTTSTRHLIVSSQYEAESTSTSPSPSTSIANTEVAPSAPVDMSRVVQLVPLPSVFSYLRGRWGSGGSGVASLARHTTATRTTRWCRHYTRPRARRHRRRRLRRSRRRSSHSLPRT